MESLAPIGRRSLVDGVVEELRARILRGDLQAGEALPVEQELAEGLGVSRSAVREALNRLAAAHLVSIRHSGSKHVLDYRQSGGLELLATLLVGARGEVDARVVRSVMEMRSALAPDIARRAAERRGAENVERLRATLAEMRAAGGDLARLQDLVSELWSQLVDGSDNIAYRLAYNSLRATYDQYKHLFVHVLAGETADVAAYERIVAAVERGDAARAETIARRLIRRGEEAIVALFTSLSLAEEKRS